MDELNLGPWERLADELGLGPQDIFGNVGGQDQGGSNLFGGGGNMSGDLAYNGNPFAGDNFWNIFAGGVNPSNQQSNSGDPFSGGSSNSFGGGSSSFGGGSSSFGGDSSSFGGI